MIPQGLVPAAASAATVVLIASMFLAFLRLSKGPTLCNRVVALDLLTVLGVGMIGLMTILTGETFYLFIALIAALIGFLSTVAFAYYLEKRGP